jgi:hypothetical protein
MGSADIRSRLIGDGKHRSESSQASAGVARVMRSGGHNSCLMIAKPGEKKHEGVRSNSTKGIIEWPGSAAASR